MKKHVETSCTPTEKLAITDLHTVKQNLRQHYKTIRARLTQDEVRLYSRQIAEQLFSSSYWKDSQTVMLYLSFQNETATREIYQRGWQEGKTMLLPICAPSGGLMEMSELHSFDHLVPNRYGIEELPEAYQMITDPLEIDLCLIPGIAFDTAGTRLGFGAGYYDRYLARVAASARRIALAYQCQIHPESLPFDRYDLPMQDIITENNWYSIK